MEKNNTSQPLISILVPVYNAGKYLPKTLVSIKNQTYPNLEIICIDDGSNDNSLTVLQDFSRQDSRFKIISRANKGVAYTRNQLLQEAKGAYIAFVDSDDTIEPNYIEYLLNCALNKQADVVRCLWKEKKLGMIQNPGCSSKRNLPIEKDLKKRIFAGYYDSIVWGKLIKRSLIVHNNMHFCEDGVCEDLSFIILLFIFANKIVSVPDKLYIYCRDNPSAITAPINRDKVLWGRLLNLFYVCHILRQTGKCSSQVCSLLCHLLIWHMASLRKISFSNKIKNEIIWQQSLKELESLQSLIRGPKKVLYQNFIFVAKRLKGHTRYIWCKIFRML